MSPQETPSARQSYKRLRPRHSEDRLSNAPWLHFVMNCGSCVPKVSWKSCHTLVAISFCPTDIASVCSFSNSSTRFTHRLPPDFFIPIPGDRTITQDHLHQLDWLYQSVAAALDELVTAVGLKIAA